MLWYALITVLDLATTWPVTEARDNNNHQRQHGTGKEWQAPLSQILCSGNPIKHRTSSSCTRWFEIYESGSYKCGGQGARCTEWGWPGWFRDNVPPVTSKRCPASWQPLPCHPNACALEGESKHKQGLLAHHSWPCSFLTVLRRCLHWHTEEARGEGRLAVQDFTLEESFSASPCSFCCTAGSARVPRTQSQLLASPLHPWLQPFVTMWGVAVSQQGTGRPEEGENRVV